MYYGNGYQMPMEVIAPILQSLHKVGSKLVGKLEIIEIDLPKPTAHHKKFHRLYTLVHI